MRCYSVVYESPLAGCVCQKNYLDCGLQVSYLQFGQVPVCTVPLIKRLVFTEVWVGFNLLQKKNLVHDNRKTMLFTE